MAFNPMEHMMDLKGKQYLQVMWRLVWFREEHPDWSINTELVSLDKETNTAIFKAEIMEPHTEQVLSTGYGSECVRDFKDFLEKAETKAVGRALAMLGYGTQFAPELDEEERIVDSPVSRPQKSQDGARMSQEKKKDREAVYDLVGQFVDHGIDPVFVCKLYGVNSIDEMNVDQRNNALLNMDKILAKQNEKGQKK